jgi:hypothetical protein
VVGLGLIAAAVLVALLLAASLRLPGLVATLLAAYVLLVANAGLVTLALSPARRVTRGGLAAAEGLLLLGALAVWWVRGRPGLPLSAAWPPLRRVLRDPVAGAFLLVAAAALGYELALALTVPANNWDALTYHLARAAAWAQHGGLYWIPNAPTDRMNEFQPLAEQQILFLFVATGSGALYALPQYLAQLAILLAAYGGARRLGFGVRAAAGSACLLATFSLVALEASTAQNDLVAASLPAVAAFFLLGAAGAEAALAGAAAGMGLGVKLTTALVWPVLIWLACLRGRRAFALAAAGAVAAFVGVGAWSYALNVSHTGGPLGGPGGSAAQVGAGPTWPGSVQTGLHVLYRTLDLSVVSHRLIVAAAIVGAAGGLVVLAFRRRPLDAAGVGMPFLSPLLVLGLAAALAFVTRIAHIPVHSSDPAQGGLNRSANEDYSAFGPLGAIVLVVVPVATAVAYRVRRADLRHLALASAFPVFVLLLALTSTYNVFLTRFLIVPVAVTAPLFAFLFRGRLPTAATLVAAGVIVGMTLANDQLKPLDGVLGRPWQLTQSDAARLQWQPEAGDALDALDRRVPGRACLGVVVEPDQPSYLLYGPRLSHRVEYLPTTDALIWAYRHRLSYAVVTTYPDLAPTAKQFTAGGWRLEQLGNYWLLAVAPGTAARTGACA